MPLLIKIQKKIDEIFEDLETEEGNLAQYKKLSSSEKKINIQKEANYACPPGYSLVRIDENKDNKFLIALLSDIDNTVIYYNEVIITDVVHLNCRPATQIKVWRTSDATYINLTDKLPGKIFFDYLLNRYDVILSDNEHTDLGRMFWQSNMSKALIRELYVYYYDMINSKLISISNQKELNSLKSKIWGHSDEYETNLAIISKIELPSNIELITCNDEDN